MQIRSFIYGIAVSAAFTGAVAVAQNKSFDDLVVANVNGEGITRRQLVSRLLEYNGDDALQKMVNRSLLLQAAKQLNVTVSDDEANQRVDQIKKQFKKEDDFQSFLTRSNLSEKQYRDEVRFTVLMEKVALKDAPVTDEDLAQYSIRMIIAPTKTEAEAWIKELAAGGDFVKLAKERSTDPDGQEAGGLMRPFVKVELLDVWRIIDKQKLRKGEYTKTPELLTDNSWAIIKLEDVIPASTQPATQKERLKTLVTRYRMDQWLSQARARAKISFPVTIASVVRDTSK
jgi:parvulin-like peptidyl-prolyl isomerase